MFKTTFGVELDTSSFDTEKNDYNRPPTYSEIKRWVEEHFDIKISKSSITMVKDKCKASKIDFKAGVEPDPRLLRPKKKSVF